MYRQLPSREQSPVSCGDRVSDCDARDTQTPRSARPPYSLCICVRRRGCIPSGGNCSISGQRANDDTPIQHVIVIFGENISFDHYFGTCPNAVNPPGQPRFTTLLGTPAVYGLNATTNPNNPSQTYPNFLTNNPNLNPANGTGTANPFRLNRSHALTADQNHGYAPEQESFSLSAMDLFPLKTGSCCGTPNLYPPVVATAGLVTSYYDGNTLTALWNYAQHFAMSDNSYNSNFEPSTPDALNLISGQTNGVIQSTAINRPSSAEIMDGQGGWTLISDSDPLYDVCSNTSSFSFEIPGKNIGDLLNTAGVTWGPTK
jgi:phospholipase C